MTELRKDRKPGRPKLPKGIAKGKIVTVRLNDEELKLVAKAARANGHKSLSSWIRQALRKAAQMSSP
jgi:uncharacterized protein (DUF1778 family)